MSILRHVAPAGEIAATTQPEGGAKREPGPVINELLACTPLLRGRPVPPWTTGQPAMFKRIAEEPKCIALALGCARVEESFCKLRLFPSPGNAR